MALLVWSLPSKSIDPWNLLNPKKMAIMILALAIIQVFGSLMNRWLGARMGALLTGFFGGLVSSTATTASLARNSRTKNNLNNLNHNPLNEKKDYNEVLIFLSATGAMLVEGTLIVLSGTSSLHLSSLFIFVGPLIATGIMIGFYYRETESEVILAKDLPFEIFPILKLSLFIISILFISKILQNLFGQSGLMILTFLVSLFEIHGSVIANVQLHENNEISVNLLSHLIAISIVASYLSKLFLIWSLGHVDLKSQAIKCTAFLFLSLFVSWVLIIKFS